MNLFSAAEKEESEELGNEGEEREIDGVETRREKAHIGKIEIVKEHQSPPLHGTLYITNYHSSFLPNFCK